MFAEGFVEQSPLLIAKILDEREMQLVVILCIMPKHNIGDGLKGFLILVKFLREIFAQKIFSFGDRQVRKVKLNIAIGAGRFGGRHGSLSFRFCRSGIDGLLWIRYGIWLQYAVNVHP